MLFSIYKFHEPKIHDTVNALYNDPTVGRALPPTKIAAAAIRIANALSHSKRPDDGNWLPSVDVFSKEMAKKDESGIWMSLNQLLGDEEGRNIYVGIYVFVPAPRLLQHLATSVFRRL